MRDWIIGLVGRAARGRRIWILAELRAKGAAGHRDRTHGRGLLQSRRLAQRHR